MTTESSSRRGGRDPDTAGNTVVGVVGLGDMGAAIAAAVLQKFPLVAFDIRPAAIDKLAAAGAQSARSVPEVAQLSDIIIIVVIDDRQVTDVVGQILRNPGRAKYVVISSTVLPQTCISLGEQAKAVGLSVIDAPVSGGAEKAMSGLITVMVGGEDAAIDGAVESQWRVFRLGAIGRCAGSQAGRL